MLFFPAWLSCRQSSFETFPFSSITGKKIQIPNIVLINTVFFWLQLEGSVLTFVYLNVASTFGSTEPSSSTQAGPPTILTTVGFLDHVQPSKDTSSLGWEDWDDGIHPPRRCWCLDIDHLGFGDWNDGIHPPRRCWCWDGDHLGLEDWHDGVHPPRSIDAWMVTTWV